MVNESRDDMVARYVAEFGSWDAWVHLVTEHPDLPTDAREAALSGFGHLRRLFGENWPAQVLKDGHPFLGLLFNHAPWTRFWIGDFADDLCLLEEVPGFPTLLARLAKADQYTGAYAEAKIAARLKRARFKIELSPVIQGRRPDIAIHNDPPLYLEVSTIRTPQEVEEAERTLRDLVPLLADSEVAIGGWIHHILPDRLIAEYLRQIREAIEQVRATKEPREIHDPGIIDLYFAPTENQELIERWKQEGKVYQVTGPPIHAYELFRVRSRLHEKVTQIPDGGVGIVVLYDQRVVYEAPHKLIVYSIDDVISHRPHVWAGVLITEEWNPLEQQSTMKATEYGWLLTQPVHRGFRETITVVRNRNPRWPIEEDLLIRLFLMPPTQP